MSNFNVQSLQADLSMTAAVEEMRAKMSSLLSVPDRGDGEATI